jgi:prepilin-type N-terminal cleavage/methylation domain-containing protein
MNKNESGYTLIELLISITLITVTVAIAGAVIFQVLRGTNSNSDRMTAVHQVQNAGFWISRDAQMAVSVNTTDELSVPEFLHLGWTEWDDEGSPIYHSVHYTFEDLTEGIGTLKRNHTTTAGLDEQTVIAEYIYYDPDDLSCTSNTSYDSVVMIIKLTSIYEDNVETREYRIKRRAGL